MLQRYEAYKESGVDWLGDIPVKWEAIRMKYLFRDHSVKNNASAELLSVTQKQGVVPRSWVENRMVMPSGNLESFKFIEKGDFAISLRSFEGGLEYCHHDGIISPAYTVLKVINNDLSQAYYKFLFKSFSFISEIQTSVVGIREGKNISFEELSYSLMPLPPLPEQTAIANFLDDKTAKIDELLEIKRRQIARLRERKQILIQNAVTKGLNPDAPMKESGVDWIGEIPAHWEVKRLKNIASITPGFAFKSSEFIVETNPKFRNIYKLLRGINVNPGKISWRDTVYWNSDQSKLIDNYKLAYGDIVIGMDRPWVSGGIRVAEITATDLPSLLLQRVARIRSNPKVHNYFIRMLITSRQFLVYFEPILTGISVPHISDSQIGNFFCAIPPLKEQEYIFKFQIKIERKINTAIKIKQSQIEKLNEYKTTLINAAVTGKIKVV